MAALTESRRRVRSTYHRRVPRLEHRPSDNPFIRYRWLLDSYREATSRGWSDDRFVELVERLDEAVAAVDGHGFRVTPLTSQPSLAATIGLPTDRLWVKDDTGNVSGSHKGRHLFGTALHLAVADGTDRELAIASCGNAALAAAVVAEAVGRPLRVFVPTWADPTVLSRIEHLGARISVCERRPGEAGDPTYLRFSEAVDAGSVPFSVQGTATPTAFDGGRTIGWELAEQLGLAGVEGRVRLFVQVGGGALAAAAWKGLAAGVSEQWLLAEPVLHAVQTTTCAPLARAWDLLVADAAEHAEIPLPPGRPARAATLAADPELVDRAVEVAQDDPGRFMWPWEAVGTSAASGILDDLTYDWLDVVEPMLRSGGWPAVVPEELVGEANRIARAATGIDVDATGTAGLAGLLDPRTAAAVDPTDHVVVLFTGHSPARSA